MGNAAQSVTAWFIDPQNTSGTASDAKDGQTSATALRTWAELVRRWGTNSPLLAQTTTVTFLSSHTDLSDPVVATPFCRSGGALIITASLPAATFTGTLNVVTAKNRAANQALQSTFNTTTGAVAANMMLVNATRANTRAFAQRNVAGGNWQISQPLNPYSGTGTPTPTQNNAWASGDTINGYSLIAVNVTCIGGQVVDEPTGFVFTGGVVLWQIQVFEPQSSNTGLDPLVAHGEVIPFIVEVVCNRSFALNGKTGINPQFMNAVFGAGGSLCFTTCIAPTTINGGIITGAVGGLSTYEQCIFSNDVIIAVSGSCTLINPIFQNGVFIDLSGATLTLTGNSAIQSGAFYGAGKVNVQEGTLFYTSGTAVANFPLSGGLQIGGLTTAYSLNNATFTPNVSLTAANLDAAAGPNGFKGTAWIPGAVITNGAFASTAALTQTTWFIDPANSQGTSSDNNTGLTSGTALRTYAELVRRWGTVSPVLVTITVTINWLSSHTDTSDPVISTPVLVNGASLIHKGVLGAAAFTGSLLAVTAKAPASNQALQATFTTTTGAIAADMLLSNTTRASSRNFVQRNPSGGTWQLSQPFGLYAGSGSPGLVENDTWANGDAIQGFTLPIVNIVRLGGQLVDVNGGFSNCVVLWQIQVFDSAGAFNFDSMLIDGTQVVNVVDCIFGRSFEFQGFNALSSIFQNCSMHGSQQIRGGSGPVQGLTIAGGIVAGSAFRVTGGLVTKDVIIASTGPVFTNAQIVQLFYDGAGVVAQCFGYVKCTGVQYGTGKINEVEGVFDYSTSAVTIFALSGGLQLNGKTTGYSYATSGGNTSVHGGISLTPANLDAAAGSAGFGSWAVGPGCCFSQTGTQP